MTRAQLNLVGVLSLLATTAVLAGGVGAAGDSSALTAALTKQLARTVTLPAAPASAPADDTGPPLPASFAAAPPDEPAAAAPSDDAGGGLPPGGVGDQEGARGDDAPPQGRIPSQIKHVFVIALAAHGFDATFGPESAAPYLTGELRPQGALLANYRSLGSGDLADHLALVGGQPPNADTSAGCTTYSEIPLSATPTDSGEVHADGCVFPNTVTTLADQVTSTGGSWGAYIEDLDKGTEGKVACRHPESNGPDDTTHARPGDGYATRHNPFVYFHSLLDLGGCDAADVALPEFEDDLRTLKDTPNFVFVAPNLCHDGTESPCVDGSPGGLPAADAFLAEWAPKILASPAYREDGLLIVTFAGGQDESSPLGALLLSRFARAGSTDNTAYDPYSLLRSIEDLFGLDPLAGAANADSFAGTVLADALRQP